MTTPYFVTGLNQRSLNFPLITLLITLTLMRGHMSAKMMMAQNATTGDLMTDPPPPSPTNPLFYFAAVDSQVKNAAEEGQ